MSKRKRDPTFTSSEKETLLKLITTHIFIVESKKTDAVSIKHKTEEWRKIATEFNANSGIYHRDWTVLKNCWENLKKKAKHEQTLRNQQQFLGTGGGPPKKVIEDPIISRVLELIQARESGFVNCFDSDGTQILGSGAHVTDDTDDDEKPDPLLLKCDIDICESQSLVESNKTIAVTSSDMITTRTIDWSQYTPIMLKEEKNQALINSPSPDVQQQQHPPDSQECHALSTPPRAQTPIVAALAATTTNHRRPAFKKKSGNRDILKEKINTLLKGNAHAEEEHEVKMKILRIQEEKEKEILKQEIFKTKQEEIKLKILELQLKKLD
ncbi:unnamed protein product [Euphydryas editha]|uniref:Regulatory protein zeste n=1 Tax=Euphydryas editha TaxID=104508 RepID=A0AAU9V3F7_EUPED|nr:unnamed protein product [Euphydryas editha]